MAKILLVEDDQELLDILMDSLDSKVYSVDTAMDGEAAWEKLNHYQYDTIVLDWELPKLSGIDVMKRFRQKGGVTPILMLTGRSQTLDKETGLDSGCDDYLTKPFDPRELTARIRALLRRPTAFTGTVLNIGDLAIETDSGRVTKSGEVVQLTPIEYKLLEFLTRNRDKPFSAEALLDRVWDSSADASIDTVRTYIKTLRKKISDKDGNSVIHTVHSVGYKASDLNST